MIDISSGWTAAQQALSTGRLQMAEAELRRLLPLPRRLKAAFVCRFWLLCAEVHARLGRHEQARHDLARAREVAHVFTSNTLLKLRYLRICLWLGEVELLGESLSSCRQALEQAGDIANLALLLCEEGRAWEVRDRLDRAETCWSQAETISRSLGVDPIRADVLMQLGRLEHLRGHLQAALDRYESARETTSIRAQDDEIRLRRLLVLLDLNQLTHARTEFARLEAGWHSQAPPEELRLLRAIVRTLLADDLVGIPEVAGYEAYRRGDMASAWQFYHQAIGEERAPPRRARVALALGMIAMATNESSEARSWLALAEQLARGHDLPEVLWRALHARGTLIAGTEGADDRARALFEEAVLVFEAQSRKLRHRVDAMTLGLRRQGILRALLQGACRRGEAAAVFRYQELERGRLLLELWRAAPGEPGRRLADDPRLRAVDHELAGIETALASNAGSIPDRLQARREELLIARDRLLDEYLRDRSRVSLRALPCLPEISDLEKVLKPGVLYLAPSVIDDELYLLACRAGFPAQVLRASGSASEMTQCITELRLCLDAQLDRYRAGFPLGTAELSAIDRCLDDLGRTCLGNALRQVLDVKEPISRIIWVPDGVLHGVPLHALRLGGQYLIERYEVAHAFGGAFVVHQAQTCSRRAWFRRAVVVAESPSVLPSAAQESEGVAHTFQTCTLLKGEKATRTALRQHLRRASIIHFACHAYFDDRRPLSAAIGLPSGEMWRALDWLDEPLDGVSLVTLSACRSAEVGPLVGKEVFGLVTGLLAAGVRSVVAGLWPVADREALPFMWRFYRHRMLHDIPTALAMAQREAIGESTSPMFWAAFAFFGDPEALPAPGGLIRWLTQRRQARHARQYALSPLVLSPGG
jgi:tetratricopeptide (TPR) repeat protein